MALRLAPGATGKAVFTADDLFDIQAATGKNYELVRGELFEVAPPTIRHGEIQVALGSLLMGWAKANKAGRVVVESGVWLERNPDTVRGPDVSYFGRGRVPPEQTRRGYTDVAPDLAVEIRSPNDTRAYVQAKAREYLAAGTKLVMLIEPDEYVELLRPGGERRRLELDDVIEADDVLPGFRCRVRDLFPEES